MYLDDGTTPTRGVGAVAASDMRRQGLGQLRFLSTPPPPTTGRDVFTGGVDPWILAQKAKIKAAEKKLKTLRTSLRGTLDLISSFGLQLRRDPDDQRLQDHVQALIQLQIKQSDQIATLRRTILTLKSQHAAGPPRLPTFILPSEVTPPPPGAPDIGLGPVATTLPQMPILDLLEPSALPPVTAPTAPELPRKIPTWMWVGGGALAAILLLR